MSAIFGAFTLFYALALTALMLALAADSRPVLWTRTQGTANSPAFGAASVGTASDAASSVEMSDDERILSTPVAGTVTAKPTVDADSTDASARAA